MKIKVRYTNPDCKITTNGNMYDLRASEEIVFKQPRIENDTVIFDSKLIPLGVAIELPKYFEATIIPRSSLFGATGLMLRNSVGEIDGKCQDNPGYIGNNDIWQFGAIAYKDYIINPGDKLCQFRIQPCMKAPWYVKLRWIFTNKPKFIEVDILYGKNRGGHGTSNGYKNK